MSHPVIAQIAVENTVYHFDRLFSYAVPEEKQKQVLPGVRVTVPFGTGNRERVGIVFSLSDRADGPLKSILSVLDREPVLSAAQLELVCWMKDRYFCTLYDGVKLMLPTGMQLRLKSSYVLAEGFKEFDKALFSELQWRLLMLLSGAGKSLLFEKLSKELGIAEDCPEFLALQEQGIVCKVSMAQGKVGDAVSRVVRAVSDFSGKLSPRQKETYQTLLETGEVSEKELCYFTGVSSSVVKALREKGAAEIFEYERYRRPDSFAASTAVSFSLSEEQQQVLERLVQEYKTGSPGCALLYGVTGSGKTSVFLKLIEYVLQEGKTVIVMVPEISLTAQTIRVFRSMFGDAVALFHSGLSLGERLDEWKRVKRAEVKIVVGTRSAVFAPVQNLGLIVIDEEQEHTYKSESSPRYDAREVARYLCHREGAFCLLSSATPSVDSCRMAMEGKFAFHQLSERFGEARIPEVELADRNEDTNFGEENAIGDVLGAALTENFQQGKQSIVLLNRRGYHTFASCRVCSEVVSCPNCSISMTYHSANSRLMCHYCGYSIPFSPVCPSCGSEAVQFRGAGTQKAEEQLAALLPEARILRVDTDSVAAKYSLEKKLDEFAAGAYDIMVGTQMVAKGLDFEKVTLVGVLSADQALFSDDFRSNERSFDLLTQVVGRAGRGRFPGRAIIQTYAPENPVLHLAAKQDYFSFYRQELEYRKNLLYPPFVDLLMFGFVGSREDTVKAAAEALLHRLSELAGQEYAELPLRVLCPSPAAIAKMSKKYRYKLLVKCRNTVRLREMVSRLLSEFARLKEYQQVTVYADSNPYTIL